VTAIYLFIDLEKSTAIYAGSAHPPLLLWQVKAGKATEYCENGFMLGPFRDSTYPTMTFSLEKGDKRPLCALVAVSKSQGVGSGVFSLRV
jgi:serine phosphatase RsbU (regulator of sigma subunit)